MDENPTPFVSKPYTSDTTTPIVYRVGDIISSERREVIVNDDDDKNVRVLIRKHNLTNGTFEFGVIVDANVADNHGKTVGQYKMCVPLPSQTWEQAAKDSATESILRDGVLKLQAQEQRKQIAKELVQGAQAGRGMIHEPKESAIKNVLKFLPKP